MTTIYGGGGHNKGLHCYRAPVTSYPLVRLLLLLLLVVCCMAVGPAAKRRIVNESARTSTTAAVYWTDTASGGVDANSVRSTAAAAIAAATMLVGAVKSWLLALLLYITPHSVVSTSYVTRLPDPLYYILYFKRASSHQRDKTREQ